MSSKLRCASHIRGKNIRFVRWFCQKHVHTLLIMIVNISKSNLALQNVTQWLIKTGNSVYTFTLTYDCRFGYSFVQPDTRLSPQISSEIYGGSPESGCTRLFWIISKVSSNSRSCFLSLQPSRGCLVVCALAS